MSPPLPVCTPFPHSCSRSEGTPTAAAGVGGMSGKCDPESAGRGSFRNFGKATFHASRDGTCAGRRFPGRGLKGGVGAPAGPGARALGRGSGDLRALRPPPRTRSGARAPRERGEPRAAREPSAFSPHAGRRRGGPGRGRGGGLRRPARARRVFLPSVPSLGTLDFSAKLNSRILVPIQPGRIRLRKWASDEGDVPILRRPLTSRVRKKGKRSQGLRRGRRRGAASPTVADPIVARRRGVSSWSRRALAGPSAGAWGAALAAPGQGRSSTDPGRTLALAGPRGTD